LVSRTINTVGAQVGLEETEDSMVMLWIQRGGYLLEALLDPNELAELGRWIQERDLEMLSDSVAD
jgi:hypothetical protein